MTTIQVLEAMREGATLHMGWVADGKYFWLNPGTSIETFVAEAVIHDSKVMSQPDSMFGVTAQTYVHKDFVDDA